MDFLTHGFSHATEKFGDFAQREHRLNFRYEPCGPPGTYAGMVLSNHGTKGPLIHYGRHLRGLGVLGGGVGIGISAYTFHSEGVNARTVGSFIGSCAAVVGVGAMSIAIPWVAVAAAAVAGGLGGMAGEWVGEKLGAIGEKLGGVDLDAELRGLENFPLGNVDDLVIVNGYIVLVSNQGNSPITLNTNQSVTLDDLLWLIYWHLLKQKVSFSLDPFDSMNPDGAEYQKSHWPASLACTKIGETMFITDYDMKQYSLGLKSYSHPQYRSTADISFAQNDASQGSRSRCRMWLSCERVDASVSHNDTCISFDNVQLKCNMKQLTTDPTSPNGLRDIDDDSDTSFSEYCKVFNMILPDLCRTDIHFCRLRELYKLNALAHWLVTNKHLQMTVAHVEKMLIAKGYPVDRFKSCVAGPLSVTTPSQTRACSDKVPRLSKEHAQVTQTAIPNGIQKFTRTLTLTGGVDLNASSHTHIRRISGSTSTSNSTTHRKHNEVVQTAQEIVRSIGNNQSTASHSALKHEVNTGSQIYKVLSSYLLQLPPYSLMQKIVSDCSNSIASNIHEETTLMNGTIEQLLSVPCVTNTLKMEKLKKMATILLSSKWQDALTKTKKTILLLESGITSVEKKVLSTSDKYEIDELKRWKESLIKDIAPKDVRLMFIGTACRNTISIFVPSNWQETNMPELSSVASVWVSPSTVSIYDNSKPTIRETITITTVQLSSAMIENDIKTKLHDVIVRKSLTADSLLRDLLLIGGDSNNNTLSVLTDIKVKALNRYKHPSITAFRIQYSAVVKSPNNNRNAAIVEQDSGKGASSLMFIGLWVIINREIFLMTCECLPALFTTHQQLFEHTLDTIFHSLQERKASLTVHAQKATKEDQLFIAKRVWKQLLTMHPSDDDILQSIDTCRSTLCQRFPTIAQVSAYAMSCYKQQRFDEAIAAYEHIVESSAALSTSSLPASFPPAAADQVDTSQLNSIRYNIARCYAEKKSWKRCWEACTEILQIPENVREKNPSIEKARVLRITASMECFWWFSAFHDLKFLQGECNTHVTPQHTALLETNILPKLDVVREKIHGLLQLQRNGQTKRPSGSDSSVLDVQLLIDYAIYQKTILGDPQEAISVLQYAHNQYFTASNNADLYSSSSNNLRVEVNKETLFKDLIVELAENHAVLNEFAKAEFILQQGIQRLSSMPIKKQLQLYCTGVAYAKTHCVI